MPMLGAIIVPHPPLIIPAVGRGQEREVQATIDAYLAAAKQVADWTPEVLIVTSPHTIMYADYFHISPGSRPWGSTNWTCWSTAWTFWESRRPFPPLLSWM